MKYFPFAVFALLVAFFVLALHNSTNNVAVGTQLIGKPLPTLSLPSLRDNKILSINAIAEKKPVIVHFFASWCVPCVIDHETMLELKGKYKVSIIGIAWKNKPDEVKLWLEKHGNPYDAVLLDTEGASTVPFGLSGVPETFGIDKKSIIRFHIASNLTPELKQDLLTEVK